MVVMVQYHAMRLIACVACVVMVWCGGSGGKTRRGHGSSDDSSNGWWWGGWDDVVQNIRLYNIDNDNNGGGVGDWLGCGYAQVIRALP